MPRKNGPAATEASKRLFKVSTLSQSRFRSLCSLQLRSDPKSVGESEKNTQIRDAAA
jgi:hypothetical protein